VIRDEWTAKQAVDDLEHQLAGVWRPNQVIDKRCRPKPAQRRLVQALTAPSDNRLEGQYRRRDNAMDAVIAYCIVEEGQTSSALVVHPLLDLVRYANEMCHPAQLKGACVSSQVTRHRDSRCLSHANRNAGLCTSLGPSVLTVASDMMTYRCSHCVERISSTEIACEASSPKMVSLGRVIRFNMLPASHHPLNIFLPKIF
jgi:hypothetical protein